MDRGFLQYLFNEGIYVIPGEEVASNLLSTPSPVEEQAAPPSRPAREDMSLQEIIAEDQKKATQEVTSAPESNTPVAKAVTPNYEVEGNFNKKVLILADQLPFQSRELLLKILGAVKLTLDDVIIVDCNKQRISLQDFIDQMQPTYLIAFGMEPYLQQSSNLQKYQAQSSGKTTLLFADSLLALEPSKELKTNLWKQLQQIFT